MIDHEPVGDAASLDQLLAASARGNVDAFRALYEQTNARLFTIALRIARRQDVAEDVLQDAYVTMWTKAHQYRGGGASVFGWMATIVRHRAIDRIRGEREDPSGVETDTLVDSATDSAEELAFRSVVSDQLRRCIEALEPSPRQAILLAYYRGYSHDQVAKHLDAPLGTVKSWVRRGLLQVKQCLSG